MKDRPVKPQKLKELTFGTRPSGLTSIFADSLKQDLSQPAGGLALVDQPGSSTAKDLADKTTAVVTSSVSADAPTAVLTSVTKTHIVRKDRAAEDGRDRTNLIAFILIALLLGTAWIGLDHGRRAGVAQSARGLRDSLQERVKFHMVDTGIKLNQERVNVELENAQTAPALANFTKPARQEDLVLSGLPLLPEQRTRESSRDRTVAADPDYADNRVMYSVQEEKAAADWEARAQREYIDEFVSNARMAGYKVKVGPSGEVLKVEAIRRDGSARPVQIIKSSGGAVR